MENQILYVIFHTAIYLSGYGNRFF